MALEQMHPIQEYPFQHSLDGEGTGTDSVEFPMEFNFIRLHQIVNKRLIDGVDGFYTG